MKKLTTLLMILVVQVSFASSNTSQTKANTKKSIYNNYLLNHDDSGAIEKSKKIDCEDLKESKLSENQLLVKQDDSGLITAESSTLSAGCKAEGNSNSGYNTTDYL